MLVKVSFAEYNMIWSARAQAAFLFWNINTGISAERYGKSNVRLVCRANVGFENSGPDKNRPFTPVVAQIHSPEKFKQIKKFRGLGDILRYMKMIYHGSILLTSWVDLWHPTQVIYSIFKPGVLSIRRSELIEIYFRLELLQQKGQYMR